MLMVEAGGTAPPSKYIPISLIKSVVFICYYNTICCLCQHQSYKYYQRELYGIIITMLKKLVVVASFIMFCAPAMSEPIVTESTSNSNVTTTGKSETTVKSPPASAIAPAINTSNSDLCTVGGSAAVQTQILGISGATTVRDLNCERLKLAKTIYDMGMKVAAVSIMCQDTRVFEAMEMAGTPCPYLGKIGEEAQKGWDENPELKPSYKEQEQRRNDKLEGTITGFGIAGLLILLL